MATANPLRPSRRESMSRFISLSSTRRSLGMATIARRVGGMTAT